MRTFAVEKCIATFAIGIQEQKSMSYRILLVDDETDILEFISYNLQREGYEVFTAQNGEEALRIAAECRPHLVLLDRMMPVMDGAATCRALRENPLFKETIIVFLSALGEVEEQLVGFDMGADDYLTKPIRIKLLISRLQAILKRVKPETEEPATATDTITLDAARHTVHCPHGEVVLPRKEIALLELLMAHPGELVSREEIYSRIWGEEVVVGDRTIDVHIRKLRQKIGEQHIRTIKGVGYLFEN